MRAVNQGGTAGQCLVPMQWDWMLFLYNRKVLGLSYYIKKPAGQDRTAAERNMLLKATRRRRRILQSRILFD